MSELNHIRLKVCGLRDNINEVVALQPDLLGFIFYDKSPRFVGDLSPEELSLIPKEIDKVGVFVNSDIQYVRKMIRDYNLQYVQLHGDETVSYCKELKEEKVKLIKVFAGNKELDPALLKSYASSIDFFMFDTKTDKYGGTGHKFDWSKLTSLQLSKPIFLSGGIDLDNVSQLEEMEDLNIYAIDVNSKFEISPGLKNIDKLNKLKEEMGNAGGNKLMNTNS